MRLLTLILFIVVAAALPAAAQSNALAPDPSDRDISMPAPAAARSVAIVSASILPTGIDAAPRTLQLDIILRETAPMTIELIDDRGERTLVSPASAVYIAGGSRVLVPLGDLRAGSYLLRLSTPRGLAQQRVAIGD